MNRDGLERRPRATVVVDGSEHRRSLLLQHLRAGGTAEGFASTDAFLNAASCRTATCVVVDYDLEPSPDKLLSRLAGAGVGCPVLYLGTATGPAAVMSALRAGIIDFLEWPVEQRMLSGRVEEAVAAHLVGERLQARMAIVRSRLDALSRREREVMRMVAAGMANKVVSYELGISRRTVEVHRANAMKKIGADSIAHLVLTDLIARCLPELTKTAPSLRSPAILCLLDALGSGSAEEEDLRVA